MPVSNFYKLNMRKNDYLDYEYHREHFKQTFNIRFTRIHDECKYDQNIARLIFCIWELCQTYSCCMPYNGNFCNDMKFGRNHFILADFRLTGIYLYCLSNKK